MKKNIIIFLFCWLTAHAVSGQLVKEPSNMDLTDGVIEKISLFTDRNFYLSGEELWFVAYIFVNDAPFIPDFSQVLYVELSGNNQKSIVKKKFKAEGGIVRGNFEIPEEALSDHYILRAYTQFLRNSPSGDFFTTVVTVINPERPLPENSLDATLQISKNDSTIPVEIMVSAGRESFQQREFVELSLSAITGRVGDFAHLSVSVVKQGTYNNIDKFISENTDLQKPNSTETLLWLPEIRDVSISGIIRNKLTKQPEPNIRVYLSVLGAKPQFHIISSRKNGEFIFSLNHATNLRDIFVCFDPDPKKDLELLINNDFSRDYPSSKETDLAIDTSFKRLIEEMYVNQQAGKVFQKKDTAMMENVTGTSLIFGKPEISVLLKDFIDLPTLGDIFKELVTAVSIKKKKGKSTLQVLNAETSRMNNCGYIFLDNVLVFDVDALLKIPPSKIERIDVINRTTYFGDFALEGIILITTNTDNFAGFTFPEESVFLEYQAISPASDFSSPDYSNIENKQSRVPDFRTLLYWNPDVKLEDGKATISFYTSDHCSAYDVIVRGFTAEGNSCFGKATIQVNSETK